MTEGRLWSHTSYLIERKKHQGTQHLLAAKIMERPLDTFKHTLVQWPCQTCIRLRELARGTIKNIYHSTMFKFSSWLVAHHWVSTPFHWLWSPRTIVHHWVDVLSLRVHHQVSTPFQWLRSLRLVVHYWVGVLFRLFKFFSRSVTHQWVSTPI